MAASAAPAKSAARPTNRLVLARAGLIALLTVLALWLAMVANVLPRPLTLREGDVSPFDLHSPIKATYVSQVRTKQDRERAANAVSPVYEININLVNAQRKAQTA